MNALSGIKPTRLDVDRHEFFNSIAFGEFAKEPRNQGKKNSVEGWLRSQGEANWTLIENQLSDAQCSILAMEEISGLIAKLRSDGRK